MDRKIIIFEEISDPLRLMVRWYLFRGLEVRYYRINSHCKYKAWVNRLIRNRAIIKIDDKYNILSGDIGNYSDLAYENIDKVSEYFLKDDEVVRWLVGLYKDERIYDIFKKNLLGKLHRFYYINYILNKSIELNKDKHIYFVSALTKEGHQTNIMGLAEYNDFIDLISKSGAFYYDVRNITFPLCFRIISRIRDFKGFLVTYIKIIGFIFWATSVSFLNLYRQRRFPRKNYKFGITVIVPERQFANKIQRVDFLIDGTDIKKSETLFICWKNLSKQNRIYMDQNGLNYVEGLLNKITIKNSNKVSPYLSNILDRIFAYRRKSFILDSAMLLLIYYAIWESFCEIYHIDNFISYCDFGFQAIARNAILTKGGTRTWYYIDAINWNNYFVSKNNKSFLPLYSYGLGYLFYDFLLSWSDELIDYFRLHRQNVKRYINIGCVWSGHIRDIQNGSIRSNFLELLHNRGFKEEYKLISVFDSVYSDYTITTPEDGVNFLEGIYRLLEEMPNVFVVFKEKKRRDYVAKYCKEILVWFTKLENHLRCYVPLRDASSSEAIAFSDLVISFPFTSPTFEALSARRKALYYDASNKFRGTFYDKVPRLVCHSYDELLSRTKELLFEVTDVEYNKYLDEFVKEKVEPYLDSDGLTRFKRLLTDPAFMAAQKSNRSLNN